MIITAKSGQDFFEYDEELYDDGYFYRYYVFVDGKPANLIITESGVSVEFEEGNCVHTSLIPKAMFQNQKSLDWEQVKKIITIIVNTELEGVESSKEQMDELYEKWKKLNKE